MRNNNVLKTAVLAFVVFVMMIASGCGVPAQSNTSTGGETPSSLPTDPPNIVTDPQTLLIPRWFLSALTLNGQSVDVAEGQQDVTLQFVEGGQMTGTGGCNNISASYEVGADGALKFSPVISTKMFCEGKMELEQSFTDALAQVERFQVENGLLTLSSGDGQTVIVLQMPPK